jgi:glycosyltransferase involved in cell wall biosynthesis
VPSDLRFLAGSRGEIGPAKGGYVVSRGGWMSDRSAVYLALGCPVVLQDTGWPEVVPPQPGLLPFRTVEEAADRVDEIESDLQKNRQAAAVLAETIFSPERALAPLLNRLA